MRLVFCGTPEFAVPTFKAVLDAGHEIALAVTQPDRPTGRGMQLLPPPVKAVALDAGIPVVQPERIKHNEPLRAQLTSIAPDAILVVAYGRIIPRWMLDLPPLGNLNLHGSLLPRYRGAAPVQWAVANGDPATGITTMRIDEGLDTGDMLLQRELPIADTMTAEDLFPLLAEAGAALMTETLEGLARGTLIRRKQNDAEATFAPILTREDGRVDFRRPAQAIYNRWRGFQPWPGAWTLLGGKKLTLSRMAPTSAFSNVRQPGELVSDRQRLFAGCGDGTAIELLEVQLEGRKRLPAAEFLRGVHLQPGTVLGS